MKNILTTSLTRRDFIRGGLGTLFLLGVGAKGYANTFAPEIVLEQALIQIPDFPPAFRGLKIAQLSDLHSSSIVSADHIAHAVDLVMSQKPDMIALTGDYIGRFLKFSAQKPHAFDKNDLDRCIGAIAGLHAPLGIYAVLGNHDFWSGSKATEIICRALEGLPGLVLLRNTHARLEREGDAIEILGVDDYWEDSCSLDAALRETRDDVVKILLSHNPDINDDIFLKIPPPKIRLVLSGHTHGGQVVLPVIGPPFPPGVKHRKYYSGLAQDGNRYTYINRGVGHLLFPIRFNCPPEATIITLDR